MKFILAEKKAMTQKFAPDGTVIPVTKVVAGPCIITQLKSEKADGYTAVQLGFGSKRNLNKSAKGHLKNLGNSRYLKEFRISEAEGEKLAMGQKITVSTFSVGDIVKVSGITKGKGFQGVVRRHGFHGSPATHGHKDQLRMSGSIGSGGAQHVFKGTRMGGRMGGGLVTVKNLEIIEVDLKNNEIFIKGALPGSKSNLLLISGAGDLIIEEPNQPDISAKTKIGQEDISEVKNEAGAQAKVKEAKNEETKPAEKTNKDNKEAEK